jgi:N-acetyl-gamma-glutamyl-phosphate reductase
MIKVGIVGGTQRAAGELIRILLNHPDVEIVWVNSNTQGDTSITNVHRGLVGETDLHFSSDLNFDNVNMIFLCGPAGSSAAFMQTHGEALPQDMRIIDMAGDFTMADENHDFVYGLSELNRKYMVHDCFHVSNAGAFAMAIELALLPLAKNLLLNNDIYVTAITSPNAFNEAPVCCSGNACVKQPFRHNQTQEVVQTLKQLQLSFNKPIHFIPMQGSFERGLLAAVHVKCNVDIKVIRQLYDEYYDDHHFTFITDNEVQMQDVVNTNKCLLHLERIDDQLLITAAIDDVMKGAAGNAVHCMNLLFGLHERVGLLTKSSAL